MQTFFENYRQNTMTNADFLNRHVVEVVKSPTFLKSRIFSKFLSGLIENLIT